MKFRFRCTRALSNDDISDLIIFEMMIFHFDNLSFKMYKHKFVGYIIDRNYLE